MFASGLIWSMETVSLLTARRSNIFSTTTQFSSNDIEITSTNSQSRFAVISFCQPDLSFCTNLNIEDILTSTNPGCVVTSPWRSWPGSITETWRRHLLWRWREVSWGQVLPNNKKYYRRLISHVLAFWKLFLPALPVLHRQTIELQFVTFRFSHNKEVFVLRWNCGNLLLMASLHQIGLAIGLNPSRDPQSVMFPLYR